MNIACGTDIIDLRRTDGPWRLSADKLRIYHPHELAHTTTEQRAGTFALKEAALKALGLAPGSWLELSVERLPSGKPTIQLINGREDILSLDCSLSHDGDYLVAIVVALIE